MILVVARWSEASNSSLHLSRREYKNPLMFLKEKVATAVQNKPDHPYNFYLSQHNDSAVQQEE